MSDISREDSNEEVVSHGHSHNHSGVMTDWTVLQTHPLLKFTVVALVVVAVATVVGLVILWPNGEGREKALENAEGIGLSYDLHNAKVTKIVDEVCSYVGTGTVENCRTVYAIPEGGSAANTTMVLGEYSLSQPDIPKIEEGENIIVGYEEQTDFYFYLDKERRASMVWLTIFFVAVVLALSKSRGFFALLSMAFTVAVLIGFIAPSVLDGNDPVAVAIVASSVIAFMSLYLTHGFTPMTTLALAGTLGSLLVTFGISVLFFDLASFTGFTSDAGLTLPYIQENLNISSLLLAGAVIGALGALDDVTITQAATIAELHERKPSLTTKELFTSGIKIGREHIASTVNTLLLAYSGAALPLLLLFATSSRSLSDIANTEEVAVEIVRTLCGSIGLVTAVPVTTFLAAVLVGASGEGTEKVEEAHT